MITTFLIEAEKLNNDNLFLEYYNRMSVYRKEKIDRLKQRKDKNLSLAVGIIIDTYLQSFGLRECDMNYSTKENGKPFFTDFKNLHFNASHSGNIAVCAFSENEIGCDVQQICKARENVAKRFFTNNEYNYIYSCNDKNIHKSFTVDERFARIWAIKESYLKLNGSGLGGGLTSFDIIIEENTAKIANKDIWVKEYRYNNYYIALCSEYSDFCEELEILSL